MTETSKKILSVFLIALIGIKSDTTTVESNLDETPLDYFSPGFFFIYKNKANCVKNGDGYWEFDITSFWVNGYNPATFTGEWDTATGIVNGQMQLIDVKTVTLLISDKNWAGIWRGGHLKIDNFTEAVLLSAKFKEDSLNTFDLTSNIMACAPGSGLKIETNNAVKRDTYFPASSDNGNINLGENNENKIAGGVVTLPDLCEVNFDLNDHAKYNIEGVSLKIKGFYIKNDDRHNAGESIGGYYGMALFSTAGGTRRKYRMNFWQDNFSVDLYYYLQWQTIPWYISWWMITIYVITLLLIIIGVITCICTCGKSSEVE